MATPRRPYVMVPLGTVENAIAAGASPSSALLLLRIWTHRDKRSIPGLLRSGPAGLSETLNVPVAQVQRQLAELECVGRHPVRSRCCASESSASARSIAIFSRTENAVRGMAK